MGSKCSGASVDQSNRQGDHGDREYGPLARARGPRARRTRLCRQTVRFRLSQAPSSHGAPVGDRATRRLPKNLIKTINLVIIALGRSSGADPPTIRGDKRAEAESGAAGEPSKLRPRCPLRRYARLIAARSGMRRSSFQQLAAPIAVASRPAPARLASPVAWSPFAPPFARGVRPDGTGSASRPVLSTLAAAESQSPVVEGDVLRFMSPKTAGRARRTAHRGATMHL